MKNIITLIILFSAFLMKAQTPNYAWVNSCTSGGIDLVHVAVDEAHDAVYTTGSFDFGRIKFSSSFDLPSANSGSSMFLAKYTLAGALVWAKVFAGPYKDCMANGIAVDKTSGNIYVTGNTGSNNGSLRKADTIHFGSQLFIDHNWVQNAFLVKIDPNGNPLWVRGGLGPNDSSLVISNAVAVDAQGNPYITGTYFYEAQFGATLLKRADHWDDMFLVKYDKNGNELMVKQTDGTIHRMSSGLAINIDKAGNILIGGNVNDDPVASVLARAIIKYDNTGAFQWMKIDGIWQSGTVASSISSDDNQNIYISGYKGVPTVSRVNTAYKSIHYITKFATNGDSLWSVLLDTTVHAGIDFRTTADAAGNVYALFGIIGYDSYTCTIGTYSNTLHTNSIFPIMMVSTVVKFNTSGTVVWGKSTTGGSGQFYAYTCQGFDLCLDNVGNIYTGGRQNDSAYFDNLKSYGGTGTLGLYTAKLGNNANGINEMNSGEENIFLWPNPSNISVSVFCPATESRTFTIEIIDMNGRSILRQDISENNTAIDLRNFSNGIYFISLMGDKKITTQKLVINH